MKSKHGTKDKSNAAARHTVRTRPATGRDEKGRFGKGNSGGPGNPFMRQTARLRRAALDAVSGEDMRDVINALKEKAKTGDVQAARLLLSYTVGKPAGASDPDTANRHELQMM